MNHFSQQLNMSHISQCKPLGIAAVTLYLIVTNWGGILQAYDLRRFQAELRSSDDAEQTLATSDTQMAKLMRGAGSIRAGPGNLHRTISGVSA